jgi:hypothetical protein
VTGIFASAPQEIEGNEVWLPAAEQQIIEPGSARQHGAFYGQIAWVAGAET